MATHQFLGLGPITVLITGAGAPGAPGIIKSLRCVQERKIRIIGVDMNPEAVGGAFVDAFYKIPPAYHASFINTVLQIAKRENADVVLPLVTRELEKFSKSKNIFKNENIAVSVSDRESLKMANNKYLMMEFCRKSDVPVPHYYLSKTLAEFVHFTKQLGYPKRPVCIKPPLSNGMRGFRILTLPRNRFESFMHEKPTGIFTSLEELVSVLKSAKNFPELLIMEYLPGKEYSVDVIAKDGEMFIAVPRLRNEMRFGISSIGTVVYNKKLIAYSQKIVEGLKLHGNIGLQFKEDHRGVPRIIESNPRVQGTIVLCTAAGANLVYLNIKMLLGESIKIPKVNWGTKMNRYFEEVYYDDDELSFHNRNHPMPKRRKIHRRVFGFSFKRFLSKKQT